MTEIKTVEDILKQNAVVLEHEIRHHDILYWDKNKPNISDADYDKLVKRLLELDPDNEYLQEVRKPKVDSIGKVDHVVKMLSLEKVYTREDLIKKLTRMGRNSDEELKIQPKYDGVSADLKEKILSTKEDDITHKMWMMEFVKGTMCYNEISDNIEIRGEIVFRKDKFERLQSKILRKNGETYGNTRNAVGGLLNRDDVTEDDFKAAGITEKILTLIDFESMTAGMTIGTLMSLSEEDFDKMIKGFEELEFPCDGVVFKIADQEYAASLGETRHHSKSEIAFKFSNPKGESKLIGVTWSVGKRTITPIGHIEAMELSGITIKNVNLHNVDNLRTLDIMIGDILVVERAGDVIPMAVASKPGLEREFIELTKCPVCDSKVLYEEPEYVCENPNCAGKNLVKLMDSVVRIGIERLGEPTLRKMMNTLKVKNLIDIFNLTKEDVLQLEGFADQSAANLINEIKRVKDAGVFEWQVLAAMNWEGIGTSLSKDLLKDRTMFKLSGMHKSKLEDLPQIGPERAQVIIDGFYNDYVYISELCKLLPIKENIKVDANLTKVCFTGRFPEKKSVYYQRLEDKGGFEILQKVTKDLDMLVVADPSKNSGKQQSAEKKGIKVIGIDQLLDSLN